MSKKPFALTEAETIALSAPLRLRFTPLQIDRFISTVVEVVRYWQAEWPDLEGEDLRVGKRRLLDLEKHLKGLRYTLNTTDTAWKIPIWQAFESRAAFRKLPDSAEPIINVPAYAKDGAGQFGDQFELLIIDALAAVQHQLNSIDEHNGRNNSRKRDLILHLAQAFQYALDARPTTTPDGAFIEVVAVVGDIIGVTLGKDVVASTIRDFRAETDFRAKNTLDL